MDLGGVMFGVREGVIGLISLVAVYMAIVLLRMRRLRKPRSKIELSPPVAPEPVAESVELREAAPVRGIEPPDGDDWEKVPPGLAAGVFRQGLEQEVVQLREELDAIRGELAALRDDMLHEIAHMRATQSVSPVYGDAMQMAAAGYEPAMIAERCGIARAEAELVVALAKSQER